MNAISVEVPRDVFESAHLTVDELKVEMAIHLYARGRLSAGKARELAGLALGDFRAILAVRRVPVHMDEADLADDVATLREAGLL